MFEKCALFFVASLCVLVESVTDKVSPQQRLSLKWTDDFNIELTWDEKKNCTYDVSVCQPLSCQRKSLEEASYDQYVTMEGGFLSVSVENICNNVKSDRAVLNVTYAELVSHVQCYIHTSDSASCTWQQTHYSSDVHFYYKLVCEGSGPCETVPLRECPSYIYKDQKATGCNLQINTRHSIHMLFNETLNNTPAKNTFKIVNVKASVPPLDWSVIKAEDKFNISWTPPDVLSPHLWEYTINYTECDKQKQKTKIITGYTSTQLNRVPHCQYRMSIKGQYNERGVTPWSDVKYFDADPDPKAWVYAVVFIPLLFAGLAVLIFVCCRKNMDNIFPNVPKPLDLLSDISDNNNQSTVYNLYVPSKEEEDCKFTLVVES